MNTQSAIGKPASGGCTGSALPIRAATLLGLCVALASSLRAAPIEIAQLGGFVHDSTGLIATLDATSPGYASSLDGNNLGVFSWTFTNQSAIALTNVRFFVFLDADLDRDLNTFFNEYGEVLLQELPPGAPGGALAWSSFQIDEPGFVFGSIFNNLLSGSLDNTNHVPLATPDDVSFALGFVLGDVAPGNAFTTTFRISGTPIGGLRQVDVDSSSSFYFNGFVTVPEEVPGDPTSPVPEPGA